MTQFRDEVLLRLCNAGMMCVAIGGSLIPVYLTTFSEALGGLDESQLGRLAGLLFSGFIVGILATGPLADRIGAKPFALLGTGLSAIGLVFLSDAFSYNSLLGAGFVIGLGAGILDMVMSPIVSVLAIRHRASALNRLHAFYCAGAIGTLGLASLLLKLEVSWRLVMLLFALAPAGVFIGFMLEPVPPLVHEGKKRLGLRKLARKPAFYLMLLAIALVGATEEGMAQWLPAYAERALGFSKTVAALGLAGFAMGMGSGRWLASHYAANIPPRLLVAAGAAFCGAGFLTGAFVPVAPVALLACVLVGFGCSVLWPTCLAIAADTFSHGGASLFAAMAAAGNAGCLLAPFLCGYIAESNGLHVALGVGATYPLLLVGLMVVTRKS